MTLSAFAFTSRWRPIVEIGTGDTRTPTGAGTWGASLWGDPGATWNGGEPIWRDVSCYVQTVEIDNGRDWSIDRFTPATIALAADNRDGWATATADPATAVRAGRQIRAAVVDTATGAASPLFRGFIDDRSPTFAGGDPDSVLIRGHGPVGELGLFKLLAPLAALTGAGETGDARFRRLTTMAGWPAAWIGPVDPSPVRFAGRLFDGDWAEELGITADSEGGAIVADLAGRIAYRGRDWMTWPAGTGTVWEIGNTDPAAVCPTAVEVSGDRADLANRVRYSRESTDTEPAPPITAADDTASQSLYGVLPLERSDLICADDGQVAVLVKRALRVKGAGGDRVRAATLDAATDPDRIIPMLLAADVSTAPPIRAQITVARDTLRYDQLAVLQRVSHSITGSSWTCRLGFDLAAPYVAPVARWGTASWGSESWGTAARQEIAA